MKRCKGYSMILVVVLAGLFFVWNLGASFASDDDRRNGMLFFNPVPADYDGDGLADLSIKTGDGNWLIDYASNGFGAWDVSLSGYGDENYIPVPMDYDGDGRVDLSVKAPNGDWLIDYANNGFGFWDVVLSGYGNEEDHDNNNND